MIPALLVGKEPPIPLGYRYVDKDYEAIVIGSLTIGELLRFDNEAVFTFLAQGKQVMLYTPGRPEAPRNRSLSASLASARRELKNWGVVFTDGAQRKLITAQQASDMLKQGIRPGPGAVLTPLAREILEGTK